MSEFALDRAIESATAIFETAGFDVKRKPHDQGAELIITRKACHDAKPDSPFYCPSQETDPYSIME